MQEIKSALTDSSIFQRFFQDKDLFVCRYDGVVVYSNHINKKINLNSVGALISGSWQASKALADFLSGNDEYRFCFDSSSSGFYVLPLELAEHEYYIGYIYEGITNPAMYKNKLKNLRDSLKGIKILSKDSSSQNAEENLFNDISDGEMDKLFSFAQN